jgi:hypothetical protein
MLTEMILSPGILFTRMRRQNLYSINLIVLQFHYSVTSRYNDLWDTLRVLGNKHPGELSPDVTWLARL